MIDFSVPNWLINYYHVVGLTSAILNSFGLYLLMFQCEKLGNFRYFLLVYQIVCFLTDIHVTFLMQPIPLYPIFAGFTVGVFGEWFNIPAHYSMIIVMFLIVTQLEFLVICFEKKHQAISASLDTFRINKSLEFFGYFLSVFCNFVMCIWFHLERLTKEDQWNLIRTNHKEYLESFQIISHFEIYVKTSSFIMLMIFTLCEGVFLVFLFFICIIHILRMMVLLKTKISAINYQKHKEAVQSLMVQLATATFCLTPPCLLMIFIMFELEKGQLLTEMCIMWFSLHSSLNMISLFLFFPPYRNFIFRKRFII
ncbi:hypothetical protein CRE_06604 [Caenorhabditis remanei]|uniref:Uncharacterized protein n=1 Tax=Caenorhabditis remanei TaxID=31234 RepID=E3M1R5_CAERE|nr:hypothetical protein CRE_06604 [Caenorhabditis remanei]